MAFSEAYQRISLPSIHNRKELQDDNDISVSDSENASNGPLPKIVKHSVWMKALTRPNITTIYNEQQKTVKFTLPKLSNKTTMERPQRAKSHTTNTPARLIPLLKGPNIQTIYNEPTKGIKLPRLSRDAYEAKENDEGIHISLKKRDRFLNSRILWYYAMKDVASPGVSPFRAYSGSQIYKLVDRLSAPLEHLCHRELHTREAANDKPYHDNNQRPFAETSMNPVNEEKINELNKRMTQPTFSTSLRYEPDIKCTHLTVRSTNCEKCSLTPSERFENEFQIFDI